MGWKHNAEWVVGHGTRRKIVKGPEYAGKGKKFRWRDSHAWKKSVRNTFLNGHKPLKSTGKLEGRVIEKGERRKKVDMGGQGSESLLMLGEAGAFEAREKGAKKKKRMKEGTIIFSF